MSKKKISFFHGHKKQILIITGILAFIGIYVALMFLPLSGGHANDRESSPKRVKTQEEVNECMNTLSPQGFHPTLEACKKYDRSPDGGIIIDG